MSNIVLRRGTHAQWTAKNPVLADGEPGWVSDRKVLVVGDGLTAYAQLAAANSSRFVGLPPAGAATGAVPTLQSDGTLTYAVPSGGGGTGGGFSWAVNADLTVTLTAGGAAGFVTNPDGTVSLTAN